MSSHETHPDAAGFRLSPQQEYVLGIDAGGSPAAGPPTQVARRLAAPVDAEALRTALARAVARHEILRTTFVRVPGMRVPQQVIHDDLAFAWAVQTAAPDELAHDLEAILAREAAAGLDATAGPVLRARLIATPDAPVLVLSAAPSCADAASLVALSEEIEGDARVTPAPPEPLQYADYAEWRHDLLSQPDPSTEAARALWSEAAQSRPPAPTVGAGGAGLAASIDPAISAGRGYRDALRFTGSEHERLIAAAARTGADVEAFVQAAWHALIGRLADARELVLATWCDGRTQPDLSDAVGCYSQPAPVVSRCEPDTSFAELVDQVRRARSRAQTAQDHASARALAALSTSTTVAIRTVTLSAEQARDLLAVRHAGGPQLLTLQLACSPGRLDAALSWDLRDHGPHDIAVMADRLAGLLRAAIDEPTQAITALPLVTEPERTALLSAAAGPAPGPQAAELVPARFAARVSAAPEAIAVCAGETNLTYAELDAAANRLARHLRELGCGPDARVGLCLERSAAMIVALLGILKAGGAYVPLHPEHPPARIAGQLHEAEAIAIVTETALLDCLSAVAAPIVCLDRDAAVIDAHPAHDLTPLITAENLAYVLYTSGSTGTPKGVAVTHANLANYTDALIARLGADAAPLRFGVVSALSTDLGNTAIFPALASGGSLALLPVEAATAPDAFAQANHEHPLDVLKITPSHLRALLGPGALPRRWLILGGEALSWDLVAAVRALSPACRLINHYGPTETTIGCTTYDVDDERRGDSATVPIGAPLPGVRTYVLGPGDEPVPDGTPGELCVAGAGVAAGYVGDAGATTARFVPDALGRGVMYRTGDRVRRLGDGALEFLGRVDDQVKIRGFRVEPGEVESVLATHPAVRQAAVAAEAQDGGDLRLVGYVVSATPLSVDELQAHCAQALPEYMIPSAFFMLATLPLTPSGKVDRRALGAQGAEAARREAEFVAPRDAIEARIAAIWGELLGVERVGVFDDFFSLGGHSLLATQAIMRIRREHGEIPLRALLAAPTVADLAEVVRGASGSSAAAGHGGR